MLIAEKLLRIKAIVKEIELLIAEANPVNKDYLFEPAIRLEIETCALLIEADRLGNLWAI